MSAAKSKQASQDIYVALLRGINIGGRNLLAMPRLKETFERIGLTDVVTYINSGNVLFRAGGLARQELVKQLEQAIQQDFSLEIKLLLRSYAEIAQLLKVLPPDWHNDKRTKCDVLFLWDEIAKPSILKAIKPNSAQALCSVLHRRPETAAAEHLHYFKGCVIWKADREQLPKLPASSRLAAHKLYPQMTIRNVNTVRKIHILMQELLAAGK